MSEKSDELVLEVIKLRAAAGHSTSPDQLNRILISASHDCVQLFYDKYERPAGYVLWANLCKESVQTMMRTGPFPLLPEDWCEGRFLFVVDLLLEKRLKSSPKQIMLSTFGARRIMLYLRRNKLRAVNLRKSTRVALSMDLG